MCFVNKFSLPKLYTLKFVTQKKNMFMQVSAAHHLQIFIQSYVKK